MDQIGNGMTVPGGERQGRGWRHFQLSYLLSLRHSHGYAGFTDQRVTALSHRQTSLPLSLSSPPLAPRVFGNLSAAKTHCSILLLLKLSTSNTCDVLGPAVLTLLGLSPSCSSTLPRKPSLQSHLSGGCEYQPVFVSQMHLF